MEVSSLAATRINGPNRHPLFPLQDPFRGERGPLPRLPQAGTARNAAPLAESRRLRGLFDCRGRGHTRILKTREDRIGPRARDPREFEVTRDSSEPSQPFGFP